MPIRHRSPAGHSLRGRLIRDSLLALLVIGALSTLIDYRLARVQTQELFDAEMAQTARTIQSFLRRQTRLPAAPPGTLHYDAPPIPGEPDEPELFEWLESQPDHGLSHYYERRLLLQIRRPDGRLLLETPSARDASLPRLRDGFGWFSREGQRWRTFSLDDQDSGLHLQLAQRDDVRSELSTGIALSSALPHLLLLPVLAFILWWLIGRAFGPIHHLSTAIAQRSATDTSAFAGQDQPEEIRPLVDALNHLLQRVQQQSDRERAFTADAAHELRTPLTALQLNLQNSQRRLGTSADPGASTPRLAAVGDSLRQAELSVRRMNQLVEQLLTLSRLDASSLPGPADQVARPQDVPPLEGAAEGPAAVIESLLKTYATPCRDRAVQIEHHCLQPFERPLPDGEWAILLGNLLANALRYAPAGGTIQIEETREHIRVSDSGPGVPPSDLPRLCDRFYRVESDAATGSGLGLSIVKRLAELRGLHLELVNDTDGVGGLQVTLREARATTPIDPRSPQSDTDHE